jgi:hypothetical protein
MLTAPLATVSDEPSMVSTRPSLDRPLTVPVSEYVGGGVLPELPVPDEPPLPDVVPLPDVEPLPEVELPLPEDEEVDVATEVVPPPGDDPPPQPLRARAATALTASWIPWTQSLFLFFMITTL